MTARRTVTLAIAGAAAFAGWTEGSLAAPPEAPLRGCGTRHESNQPLTDRVTNNDVRFGALFVTRYPEWRKPLRAFGANPDPDIWPYVLKMPVRLSAGRVATIAIAASATDRFALLPSNSREWLPAVRFKACASGTRAHAYNGTVGPFTGFGMSIGLKKPTGCVPIEVWLANQTSPIRRVVPIGRTRC